MLTAPPRSAKATAQSDLEALIEEARRRARRRRVGYAIAAMLAAGALLAGLLSLTGGGGGGPPSADGPFANGPGAPAPGIHNQGASNTKAVPLGPRSDRFLRTVTLPPSAAPQVVREAFAARRFSSAAPRLAARLRSARGTTVLWASPAHGGGWCQGLQEPRLRFTKTSVSCLWPNAWMQRSVPVSGYDSILFWGRVPQASMRTLQVRFGDGRTTSLPTRDGFFLYRVPEHVLVHTGPRSLLALDRQGRRVAGVTTVFGPPPSLEIFGGIRRPPGGAVLARKYALVERPTQAGRASIWAAPSYAAPARCTWLQVGRAVFGGGCRRYQPPRRGLSEVVPLRIQVRGQILNLLWGQVGSDVAELALRFQNGSETTLPIEKGAFLYPVPTSRWIKGRRPAFLIARSATGRTVGKRLLIEYTLAS